MMQIHAILAVLLVAGSAMVQAGNTSSSSKSPKPDLKGKGKATDDPSPKKLLVKAMKEGA